MTSAADDARVIADRLELSRAALLASLAGPGEDALDRTSPAGWSVLGHVEHVERSERAFLILVAVLRVKDSLASFRPRRERIAASRSLDFSYSGTSIRAPRLVRPRGGASLPVLLARLERTRRRTLRVLRRLGGLSSRGTTWPHPAFGRLDALQWLAVAALHERHHAGRIVAITSGRE